MAVVDAVVSRAMKEGRTFLFSQEAQLLIRSAGISVPKSGVARTIEEAVKLAEEIGYPVVMKVISKDILHKSDAGGVMLDLLDEEEVVDAYQAIVHNSLSAVPSAVIEGIEVAEMVSPGTEMIAGSRRDKIFGPIAMVGLGGIYVEVIKDVTFRALPPRPEGSHQNDQGIKNLPPSPGRPRGKNEGPRRPGRYHHPARLYHPAVSAYF